MSDKNLYCKRCGNCCKGMIWRKRFGFNDAYSIAGADAGKEQVSSSLKIYYKKYLRKRGLRVKEMLEPEWDTKNKVILAHAKVGQCRFLSFVDNKAICLNYENRPDECRRYLCKKAKDQAMCAKISKNEKESKIIFSRLRQFTQ